jgi:hypothetical protein
MLEWPAKGAAIGETIFSPSTDRQSPADAKFLGRRSKHTWATDSSNSSGSWPFSFWIFLRAVNMAADLATYTKTSTRATSSTFEHHPHDLKQTMCPRTNLRQCKHRSQHTGSTPSCRNKKAWTNSFHLFLFLHLQVQNLQVPSPIRNKEEVRYSPDYTNRASFLHPFSYSDIEMHEKLSHTAHRTSAAFQLNPKIGWQNGTKEAACTAETEHKAHTQTSIQFAASMAIE